MKPAIQNQQSKFHSERGLTFAGFIPPECFVFSRNHGFRDTTHTYDEAKYMLSEVEALAKTCVEGPKSSILRANPPKATPTQPPPFLPAHAIVVTGDNNMPKTRLSLMQRRGVMEKLWIISDQLNGISMLIRYAEKPSDLALPITQMLQITRRLDVFKDQWLLKWLKSRNESLKTWPKLHERYL